MLSEHVADGASGFIHDGLVKFLIGQVFANDGEPQRRVRRVTIGNVISVDRVWQGAVFLKLGECQQNLFYLVRQAGGKQAARADERVASPVQKPRIAGDDGLEIIAAHDELFRGIGKLTFKRIMPFTPALSPFGGAREKNFAGFGRNDERDLFAFCQRQFKPAGAVGVATASLAAGLLDGMRDVFAPFRLRMILAAIGDDAQLPVGCRREGKSKLSSSGRVFDAK